MTNDSNTAKEVAAFEAAEKMGTEQIKVLFFVNSGAVVALLAFLQAMWPHMEDANNRELISIILWSMGMFTLGIGVILPAHISRLKRLSRLVHGSFYVSMVCFVFGAAKMIFGAMQLLQPV